MRALERREGGCARVDFGELRVRGERHLEATRVVELRNDEHVGESHFVTYCVESAVRARERLERGEPAADARTCPVADAFRAREPADRDQRAGVLQRLDSRGDELD